MDGERIVIRTDEEHEAALSRLFEHFSGQTVFASVAEFEAIADAVAAYEAQFATPVPPADAVDLMDFVVESSGLTPRAFATKHQLSFDIRAFLRREKRMTITIARELSDRFHWPAEVILRPYKVKAPRKPAAKAKPRALTRRAAPPSP